MADDSIFNFYCPIWEHDDLFLSYTWMIVVHAYEPQLHLINSRWLLCPTSYLQTPNHPSCVHVPVLLVLHSVTCLSMTFLSLVCLSLCCLSMFWLSLGYLSLLCSSLLGDPEARKRPTKHLCDYSVTAIAVIAFRASRHVRDEGGRQMSATGCLVRLPRQLQMTNSVIIHARIHCQ